MTHFKMKKKRKGRRLVIGADPGLSGGLWLCTRSGKLISAIPMPALRIIKSSQVKTKKNPTGKGKGTKGVINYPAIVSWVCEHITEHDSVDAFVEELGIQPAFGCTSNWGMSASMHLLLGIFCMAGFRVHQIRAAEWQKIIFGAKRGKADKGRSIAKAHQILNESDVIGKHDGIAEAGLMATAGIRKLTGQTLVA